MPPGVMSERIVGVLSMGGSMANAAWCSAARCLAAVDMQRLAGDEPCSLEVEHCVDDVTDVADAPQRVEAFQPEVGRGVVGGCLDDAERDGVHPDAMHGVFNRQRTAHGDETALCEGGERGGPPAVRAVGQGGGDVDDVAVALPGHLVDR